MVSTAAFQSMWSEVAQSCLTLCDPMDCSLPGSEEPLSPWNFPGKSTGVGYHFLLQGIFPTQGLNPGLQHCRQTLYRLSHLPEYIYHYNCVMDIVSVIHVKFINSCVFLTSIKQNKVRSSKHGTQCLQWHRLYFLSRFNTTVHSFKYYTLARLLNKAQRYTFFTYPCCCHILE